MCDLRYLTCDCGKVTKRIDACTQARRKVKDDKSSGCGLRSLFGSSTPKYCKGKALVTQCMAGPCPTCEAYERRQQRKKFEGTYKTQLLTGKRYSPFTGNPNDAVPHTGIIPRPVRPREYSMPVMMSAADIVPRPYVTATATPPPAVAPRANNNSNLRPAQPAARLGINTYLAQSSQDQNAKLNQGPRRNPAVVVVAVPQRHVSTRPSTHNSDVTIPSPGPGPFPYPPPSKPLPPIPPAAAAAAAARKNNARRRDDKAQEDLNRRRQQKARQIEAQQRQKEQKRLEYQQWQREFEQRQLLDRKAPAGRQGRAPALRVDTNFTHLNSGRPDAIRHQHRPIQGTMASNRPGANILPAHKNKKPTNLAIHITTAGAGIKKKVATATGPTGAPQASAKFFKKVFSPSSPAVSVASSNSSLVCADARQVEKAVVAGPSRLR